MGEDIWKEETKERQSNMKTCPNCKAMHYNEVLVCKECGYSLPESRDTQKVKISDCSTRFTIQEIKEYLRGCVLSSDYSEDDSSLKDAIAYIECDQDGIAAVTERLKQKNKPE